MNYSIYTKKEQEMFLKNPKGYDRPFNIRAWQFSSKKNFDAPNTAIMRFTSLKGNGSLSNIQYFSDKDNDSDRQLYDKFGNKVTYEEIPKDPLLIDWFRKKAKHNIAYQIVFSTKLPPTEHNANFYKEEMLRYCEENFAQYGHEYVLAIHKDTPFLHSHIILKAKNEFTQTKVFFQKEDLLYLRENYAKQLTASGYKTVNIDKRTEEEKEMDKNKETYRHRSEKASWLIAKTLAMPLDDEKKRKKLLQRVRMAITIHAYYNRLNRKLNSEENRKFEISKKILKDVRTLDHKELEKFIHLKNQQRTQQ